MLCCSRRSRCRRFQSKIIDLFISELQNNLSKHLRNLNQCIYFASSKQTKTETMSNVSVKIGNSVFTSLEEYTAHYVKKWNELHPNIHADLNWVANDWNYRINNAK